LEDLRDAIIFDEKDWSYNTLNLPRDIHQKIKDDRDKVLKKNKEEALNRKQKMINLHKNRKQ
jgi:hypothetical protein